MTPLGSDRGDTGSFGLLKFVSWGTLVLILLSSLFLSIFLANQARQALLEKQRDFAQLLANTLGSDINKRFVVPIFWSFGKPDLSKPEQYTRLDEVVRFALEGSPARDVRLYDMAGIVIYSQDRSLLGKEDLGGEPVMQAVNDEKFSFDFIYESGSLSHFFAGEIAQGAVTMRVCAPLKLKGVIPLLEGEGAPGQPAPESDGSDEPGARGGEAEQPAGGSESPGTQGSRQGAQPPQTAPAPGLEAPEAPPQGTHPAPDAQAGPGAVPGQPGLPGSGFEAGRDQGQLPGRPAGQLVQVEGVIGGLEFTLDITPDYRKLINFQRIIILANLGNALVIFFVLRMLIHRADRINAQRLREKQDFERETAQNEKLLSMGRMVAGIAHEIRNPLGIIRSSSELLLSRQKDKDPLTARILGAIHEEAVRLSKTVGDFLDYARPKALKLDPVDLASVLDQVLAFLEQKCRELSMEVVRGYGQGLTVQGDKDLLYRALYNILVNAMEAMDHATPAGAEGVRGQIVVQAESGKDGVRLTVLDTGPGIPADIRDKLMDPFFTTKQSGTGLGLAITANILRGHGALLTLGDNPEGGARVDILFPRA